jgi:hypothetical protein
MNDDLEIIKKAFGEASMMAIEQSLDEGDEVEYEIQDLSVKELLYQSILNVDKIQSMLDDINGNLLAAAKAA